MPDINTVLADIASKVDGISAKQTVQDAEIKRLGEVNYKPGNKPGDLSLTQPPTARKGESVMSSRGYSFMRLLAYCARQDGYQDGEQSKQELLVHNKLQKAMTQGTGYIKAESNSIMTPFSTAHMSLDSQDAALMSEVRQMVHAGIAGYDPEEVFAHRVKHWGREKALSWVDETAMGATVAPPQMGELIDLLRNNEALMAAGARDIGMPPQGRIVFPAQKSAAVAYFVGENVSITESGPGTGDLNLSAKKLGVMVKIPNELFRFATVAIEQFIREDIAKVMALRLDKALLEDVGSATIPKGLINYAGISTLTGVGTGTDGNTLQPEDIGSFIGMIEEQNAEFKTWIMRPLLYTKLINRRADGPVSGDGKGQFLFNMFRDYKDHMDRGRGIGSLEGYKAVKSTQVSNTRTKGAGTGLTYLLGGDFSDFIIALGGVIEFLVANQGDTMVQNDQTWVRGINYVDGGPRREASFGIYDKLLIA